MLIIASKLQNNYRLLTSSVVSLSRLRSLELSDSDCIVRQSRAFREDASPNYDASPLSKAITLLP